MKRRWLLAHGRFLDLGENAVIMGILNVTPDSFSDGGRFDTVERAGEQAFRMMDEGAAIIDIGGESTRPGASAVSAAQEQDRILPVIEALAKAGDAVLSVDTYRAETARLALAAGAHIVNDIWALQREPQMAAVAARHRAGIVLMHNSRGRATMPDLIEDQAAMFDRSLDIAHKAGVADSQIALDPGFGFGKDAAENIELTARFDELRRLGFPLVAGTSRKRFIGRITGRDGDQRDAGTAATSVILRLKGADIFRVHNVAINRDALVVADAMLAVGRLG